jgi:anaerobic selenocysteine-containing dehydrogenase
MSDERIEELGLPRRGFLKKAAAAAFAAPVIASFGLDGIAEARTGSHGFSNMTYANMTYANMTCANMAYSNMTYVREFK